MVNITNKMDDFTKTNMKLKDSLIIINIRSSEAEGKTEEINKSSNSLTSEEKVKLVIIDEMEPSSLERGEKEKPLKVEEEEKESVGPRRTGRKRTLNYLNGEHQVSTRFPLQGCNILLQV